MIWAIIAKHWTALDFPLEISSRNCKSKIGPRTSKSTLYCLKTILLFGFQMLLFVCWLACGVCLSAFVLLLSYGRGTNFLLRSSRGLSYKKLLGPPSQPSESFEAGVISTALGNIQWLWWQAYQYINSPICRPSLSMMPPHLRSKSDYLYWWDRQGHRAQL